MSGDNFESIKLLFVDDEQTIVDMYTQVIEDPLIEIFTANSAEEALNLAKSKVFDIVVSDLRMQGQSGLELLKNMNAVSKNTKFIMQTGYATVDVAIQAMKQGAYDFITKPVNLLHLRALIDKCKNQILTERENVELRSHNEKLQELNEMKEKFIAITNHELRTPLTIIKGYVDLIELYANEIHNNDMDDAVVTVKNTISDMDVIIQRMHLFTTQNIHKHRFVPVEFSLTKIVKSIIKQFDIILMSKFLTLDQVGLDRELIVKADENGIKEAISEILQNAIKFTADNGRIIIKLEREKDTAILSIIDNGKGIAKEDQEKIFDIFYESENILHHGTVEKTYMGSSLGIGLSLVKQICQNNKVEYSIESEPGKGTKFSFIFNAVNS